jgi:phage shock protein C
MRSSRERMWAGVAGGMAEYFDLDPSLVRLLWVLATLVTGGLVVPVYILAWIILPRDDRPPMTGPYQWRDWSQEFHAETQRLADEARRRAGEVGHEVSNHGRHEPTPQPAPTDRDPATDKGTPTAAASPTGPSPASPQEEWWWSDRYRYDVEPHRHHHLGRNPRSAGMFLLGLGVLLLAANVGVFNWIEWKMMWPLIFIGLGCVLLARQADWWR